MASGYLYEKYGKSALSFEECAGELGLSIEQVEEFVKGGKLTAISMGEVQLVSISVLEGFLGGNQIPAIDKLEVQRYNPKTKKINEKVADKQMIQIIGDGSFYQDKNGRYHCAFYYINDEDKKVRKVISGVSEDDVKYKFEDIKRHGFEVKKKAPKPSECRHLVCAEVDDMVQYKKDLHLKKNTIDWLVDIGKKIKSMLKGVYIEDMDTIAVQRFASGLLYKDNGEKYAEKTIKETFKMYKMLYNYCDEKDYNLKKVAFRRIKLPSGKVSTPTVDRVFSTEQLKQIYDALEGHYKYLVFVKVAVGTGARLSELLSLKWSDIHDGKINISKQLRIEKDEKTGERKYIECSTKTACSERDNVVSEKVIEILEGWKMFVQSDKAYYDKICKNGNEDWIFLNEKGMPIDGDTLRNRLKEYLKRKGVTFNVTPHMFRHCFATFMFENDVDILAISKFLGHKNSRVTSDIYTTVTDKKMEKEFQKASAKIDSVLDL